MSKLSARGKSRAIVEREAGFSVSSAPAPLPYYDALRDVNLRQHFESRGVQRFLQQKGWVDKTGKIIDLDKHRAKLNIIEQEFKYAEKTEYWRLKEEEEMRRTIQIKRERALNEAKRNDRARKIKEENRIRKGIIAAVKNQKRPEALSDSKHLDLTTGSLNDDSKENTRSPHKDRLRSAGQREDKDIGSGVNRGVDEKGGFFVTQQSGEEET